jgi:triosephosphate isomerase
MRIPIVAGNWKMNGSKESVAALLSGLTKGLMVGKAEVVVCPSFPYLAQVADKLAESPIKWGAQNANAHITGAFTGEVSVPMVKEFGCRYVILGHSERRALFAESDADIAEKFCTVQDQGLTPILCVGETLEQREQGQTASVVEKQLIAVVEKAGIAAFAGAVLAYEPVWAIGTGRTASPEQAQQVHEALRSVLRKLDEEVAEDLRILYGGSVKSSNAAALFDCPDIDGGLIGGASLDANEFIAICRAAG